MDLQTDQKAARTIFVVACAIIAALGTAVYAIDIYALNRGFSFADDSYYALSYKMAAAGFYPHFTNAPFVVAALFEWLRPGIIFYRIVHLALATSGSALLVWGIVRYLQPESRKGLTASLAACALCSVPYCYYFSAPTLSYNHLNDFLVIASEACLLLACSAARAGLLCFLAGALAALDVYIKPPSFLLIEAGDLILIGLLFWHSGRWKRALPLFVAGGVASIAVGTMAFVTPSDWPLHLAHLKAHNTHPPIKVLLQFLTTGWDMLLSSGPFVLASLALVLLSRRKVPRLAATLLILLLAYAVIRVLRQPDGNPLLGPWTTGWVYAATILVAATLVWLGTLAMTALRQPSAERMRLWLIVALLAANPIVLSAGTANGFGQVQLVCLSWFLLGGLALYYLRQQANAPLLAYVSLLLIAATVSADMFYIRLLMPMNALTEDALAAQSYKVPGVKMLQHMRVDAPTRDALVAIDAAIAPYPDAPTLVFFDMPGLQYAFGRKWIVRDPWLTDADYPNTRNDDYNCRMIAGDPAAVQGAILMVANADGISQDLRSCLAGIGYPDGLQKLGDFALPPATGTFVTVYRHP